ncbi:uncharacterized protein LOC115229930 [Octopus sinensis]|uniref:Uncharacterized protein LOC115229930 n=1 Tax=Octopus sinensis TaxID=2607531 RepID=A0A6P7U3F5_9MOLL|nr:uncharacterized protein LOC115229930 [Octopus sinensis]
MHVVPIPLDLERKSNVCLRKAGILRAVNSKKTHMATIAGFLTQKYNLDDNSSDMDVRKLKNAQIEWLLTKINSKSLHSMLFKCLKDLNVDTASSSGWLAKGNNSPRAEALYCLLQDRNLFFEEKGSNCSHCKSAKKTVDHLATRCNRMLNSDYIRRHNEVVRCLHLNLCRKYGITYSKKLKTHSVQSIVTTENVEIRVDTTLMTDIKVQHNKPDIFVFDKRTREITLVEVGITSQEMLKGVEVEKLHKYDLLAGELSQIYKAKVKIVPIVMTWEGIVSKFYKSYMDFLGVDTIPRAYIQSIVLKKTLESMLVEHRHGMNFQESDVSEVIHFLQRKSLQQFEDDEIVPMEQQSWSEDQIGDGRQEIAVRELRNGSKRKRMN